MADNVAITAGSGTTISTEEITTLNGGSVSAQHLQRVAIAIRTADGVAVDLPGDATNGQKVQIATAIPAGTNTIGGVTGEVAADAAVGTKPVAVGGRASNAVPTAMSADGDAVHLWLSRLGAQIVSMIPHLALDGTTYTLTAKTAQYTTAQTGVALWTPAAGKKLAITSYQIQAGGTTAGTVQLWFGASADTTYTRGTDLAIFDGEFSPSSTQKPGAIQTGLWIASTADHILRVTDSAAINPLTITVWGYEF